MKTMLTNLAKGLLPQHVPEAKYPSLLEQVEEARLEWLNAQDYYNNVSDTDLVDYAAYRIQAAEKKYTYLLKRARHEGIKSSPLN